MALATLKKRPEFLRVRGGRRYATAGFLLEGRARLSSMPSQVPASEQRPATDAPGIAGPRYGFTITKKLGPAVDRNRIRRRLKAALEAVSPEAGMDDFDYVVVARRPALDRPFESLKADLATALRHIHGSGHSSGANRPRKRKRTKA